MDVLASTLNSVSHLAAELFELLGCVLNNLLLALGQVLRSLANALAGHPAAAIEGLGTSLANPASGVDGQLTPTPHGIAGRTTSGLYRLSSLLCGIVLNVFSHVILPRR